MSGDGQDDADEARRYLAPASRHNPIPTIKRFREEKESRKAVAKEHVVNGDVAEHDSVQDGSHEDANGRGEKQQDAGASQNSYSAPQGNEDPGPAVDTSETDASATDPKARRKELSKRKDERAERTVTDPVTHLPVTIHDRTSKALEEISENEAPFGSASRTSTGTSNKHKSGKQLREEWEELQHGEESIKAMFPPPNFDAIKAELVDISKQGVSVGLVATAGVLALCTGLAKLLQVDNLAVSIAIWLVSAAVMVGGIRAIILGIRDWMAKRIDAVWEDEVWDASGVAAQREAQAHTVETVKWLNSLLGSVWPLINPDLFTSLADTLEDVMQASLPRMVQMVSVDDIGQGSENVRILSIRWLPTGAAARSVNQDGKLESVENETGDNNDRKVPGEGELDPNSKERDSKDNVQQGDDGSQEQVAEGMEAEEGDFVNMEVAFAYRSKSNKRSLKDRANDMHLYMAFYLPGNIKLPVWVDLRGLVGTMRLRLQLCPDPPFFSLCTLTFLGQPKVDISCTPLSKHAMNLMDLPLISNFVQASVDAAMAEYVAPKSLNLDLQDMLAGDDYKKDTDARGVLSVYIKRGYDFKNGDSGIPLLRPGSSDPYVSVGWAKFGKPMWSTRLLLNEMEPWWDETAYVLVLPEKLNVDERLRIQLWDSDRMSADDDLGRIEVDLKELMKNEKSNGSMWHRTDGFRALNAGETMPGKLEWSVGYFSKVRIQNDQLARQTYDPDIKSLDQLKQKVHEMTERKLREANIKNGKKRDESEWDQQKAQEMKYTQDAMMISAPPPDGYPSGIFSIQIHQITGLELEKTSKTQVDKASEADDEQGEGDELPSAYCTVIINHNKVFKTRTKPRNAKPFYNASTERFIADWRNAEVYVSVRDARVQEDNALLGIIHLPLGNVFRERSQINGFYPLTGGIGFGRIRLSMVWRSIQLQAPPQALGWEHGTVEIEGKVSASDVPDELAGLKLKFHTDLGSAKMYHDKHDHAWKSKNEASLKLPVRKRYSSCLALQFRSHGMLGDKTPAFAVLWLNQLVDEEEKEVSLTVWKGDYERAIKNSLPEYGEKVGTITLKLTFWSGLGAAHSKWASKDHNLQDVVEVLETARDNDETTENEAHVGSVDGNASDSSDDANSTTSSHDHMNGSKGGGGGIVTQAKDLKKHHQNLNRHHRGIMQRKIPRTAQWAKHKVEQTETKFTDMFKHHSRESGVEREV